MKKGLLQRIATTGIALFLALAVPATQTLGATMGTVIKPALDNENGDSGAGAGGSADSGSGSGDSADSGSGSGGGADSGSGSGGNTDSGSGSGGSADSGSSSGGNSNSGSGSGGSSGNGSGSGGSVDGGSGSSGSTDSGLGSGGDAGSGSGLAGGTGGGASSGGSAGSGSGSGGNAGSGSGSEGSSGNEAGTEEKPGSTNGEISSGGSTGGGAGGSGGGTQNGNGDQLRKEETLKAVEKKEAGAYFAGEGTEESPYLIQTAKELELMAKLVIEDYDTYANSCYQLTQNITMKKGRNNHTPIGNREQPFMGVFDGDGYVITGLRINSSRKEQQGLFGAVGETGIVQNVGLKENSICGKAEIGALAGVNLGTIEACFQTGEVFGISDSVGSIAGVNSGTVQNCYSTGDVYGGFKTGDDLPAAQDESGSRRAPRAGIRDFIMTVAETIAETIAETVAYVIEETKSSLENLYEMVTTAFSPEAETAGQGQEDDLPGESSTNAELDSSLENGSNSETDSGTENGNKPEAGPGLGNGSASENGSGTENDRNSEAELGQENGNKPEAGPGLGNSSASENGLGTENDSNSETGPGQENGNKPEADPGLENGSNTKTNPQMENSTPKNTSEIRNESDHGTSLSSENNYSETGSSVIQDDGGETSLPNHGSSDSVSGEETVKTEPEGSKDEQEEITYLDDDKKQPAIGGIVGRNDGGAIGDSYQAGRQLARNSEWLLGGISGENRDGIMENCYFVRGAYEEGMESSENDGVTAVTLERITGDGVVDRMELDPGMWIGKQTEEDQDRTETDGKTEENSGPGVTENAALENAVSSENEKQPEDEDRPRQYRHYFPQLLVFEERNQIAPYTLGHLEADGLRIDILSNRASVSTEEGWHWLFSSEEYLSYRITLEADLNLKSFHQSIGTWEKPFTGILDGNGHVITGLEQPLFGVMGEGSAVYYLLLDQSEITGVIYYGGGEDSAGDCGSGILAAYAYGTMVDSCGVTGTITLPENIQGSSLYVGGMIGEAAAGTSIYESYSFVTITEEEAHKQQVTAGGFTGLMGKDSGAVNCYATGRLNCLGTVGGFTGENRGEIRDSFVTTIVSPGAGRSGAFVGYMQGGNAEVSREAGERILLKMSPDDSNSTTAPEKTTAPVPHVPDSAALKPSTKALEPATTALKPSMKVLGSATTALDPVTMALELSTTVPEPVTTPPEPATSPSGPATSTPEPSTSAPEPVTSAPEPVTSTPEPATTPSEPATTPPEPATTPTESATTPPEPATTASEPVTPEPTPTAPELTTESKSTEPTAPTTAPNQLTKVEPLTPQAAILSSSTIEADIWQDFTITGCAYDMQMSGCSDPYAEGLSTVDMTGEEAVLPGGSWYRTEGAYPQLMCMAYHTNEAYILCSKASAIPLVLPKGITMYDLPVGEKGGEDEEVRIEGALELTITEQIDGDAIQWSDPKQMTVQGNGKAILDIN